MPPSGFTREQARMVPVFLNSCWEALQLEGVELGLSAFDALAKEVRNIDAIMCALPNGSLVGPALRVVQQFYMQIRDGQPVSYLEAAALAKEGSCKLREELEAIHVPDAAQEERTPELVQTRPMAETLG